MASLKSTLSFLADQEVVLIALMEAPDGLTLSDLNARVAATRGTEGGLTQSTVQRMLDLGLVEERPAESVCLELTLPVRGFLGHVLRTHELVTPEAIRGYVGEIDGQDRALVAAAIDQDAQAAVLALERLAAAIERVRSYATANHAAILERVLRAKAGADGYSVRERYLRINALWLDYLGPLRALVEPGEWAHASFDRLGGTLLQTRDVFMAHGVVADACERVRARLLRMRAQAHGCYGDAYRELLPLYERARRLSLISEGCGRWLEHLTRHSPLKLAAALSVARASWQGQFNDAALAARLVAIGRFDPAAPPPLAEMSGERPDVVSIGQLRALLRRDAPLDDLMAWLGGELETASLGELVRAFVALSSIAPDVAAMLAPTDTRWLARHDGRIGYRPLAIERQP